jgi:RND family efflux transporter MFP subunit
MVRMVSSGAGVMKAYLAVVLAASVIPWVGCSEADAPQAAAAPPRVSQAADRSPEAAPDNSFLASGPIVVEHQVDVLAERDGILTNIQADMGTRVTQGQILAQLDDRQLSADLQAAQAKTRSTEADLRNWEAETKVLEADLQRSQKMWDAQLITKEQLDHARYKVESDQWDVKRVRELLVNAQASERSLELELEKTRIRAPFSGIVARRYVRPGQQVAKADRLFWVTETAPLRMKFTVPERYLGRLHKGDVLELRSADSPDAPHKARVMQISPVVDPSSGTIEVLTEILPPTGDLRAGMSASVRLATAP